MLTKVISCPDCDELFFTEEILSMHVKKIHHARLWVRDTEHGYEYMIALRDPWM